MLSCLGKSEKGAEMSLSRKLLIAAACVFIVVPTVFFVWNGIIGSLLRYRQTKVHENAGDEYMAKKSYQDAMTAYFHARDIDQGSARILEKITQAKLHLSAERLDLLSRMNPGEIRYEIGLMLKSAPWRAAVYTTALGNTLLLEGKISDAIQQFKEALKADPKYPFPLLGLGKAYALNPATQNEAVDSYKSFVSAVPDNFDGQHELGQLYLASRKPEDAATHLSKACGIREDYRCRIGLATAYNSLQKFQEALEELGKAARLKPDAEEPNEILVDVLMGAGSFDKAENILKAILASNKGGASHAYKLGIALSRQGKHEEALQFFDQLLSQMPGDFMTLFEKAGTLEKMGKKEEALNLYQAILNSKVPDNQALAQTLGMIQEEARKRLGKQ